jgi:hypothetical protein
MKTKNLEEILYKAPENMGDLLFGVRKYNMDLNRVSKDYLEVYKKSHDPVKSFDYVVNNYVRGVYRK